MSTPCQRNLLPGGLEESVIAHVLHFLLVIFKWAFISVLVYVLFGLLLFKIWVAIVDAHANRNHPEKVEVRSPWHVIGMGDTAKYEHIEDVCGMFMVLWMVMVVCGLVNGVRYSGRIIPWLFNKTVDFACAPTKKVAFVTAKLEGSK